MHRRFTITVVAVLFALVGSGCTVVGPNYTQPDTQMPDTWGEQLAEGVRSGDADLHTWWRLFQDDQLDSLIARVNDSSIQLRLAAARIEEARALRGVASADVYPTVDAVGGLSYQRASEELSPALPPGISREDWFSDVGVDASWEVDLWGRIQRNIEAADAELGASIENYRDTLVLLYTEVALNYFELRAIQQRIQFAENNAKIQRDTLKLTQDRRDAEIIPELDVQQAKLNLATTEAAIPTLRAAEKQTIHRIAVLIGLRPSALYEELSTPRAIPTPPAEALVPMPAELLRQRPDIRSAERRLAAATARIGATEAELYPRFSLFGTFALQAPLGSVSSALGSDAIAWSIGPAVRWNVFDSGRIRSRVDAADARTQQALAGYEQTVLTALEDVRSSLVRYSYGRQRTAKLRQAVDAATNSVKLVEELYRNGLVDFQNVLDTQRALTNLQDQLATSRGADVQNLVLIYRAFGGGWAVPEDALVATGMDPERTMRLVLEPEKLQQHDLTPLAVAQILTEYELVARAAVDREAGGTALLLESSDRPLAPIVADLRQIVLKVDPETGVVRLGDVGRIERMTPAPTPTPVEREGEVTESEEPDVVPVDVGGPSP